VSGNEDRTKALGQPGKPRSKEPPSFGEIFTPGTGLKARESEDLPAVADPPPRIRACSSVSWGDDEDIPVAPRNHAHPLLSRRSLLSSALALVACSRGGSREREGPPQRIASRTVFADEVLWALGEAVRARVVGLSPMADDTRYSTVAGKWPASTPRLGTDPEQLLALAPDLVIVASFNAPEYRAAIEDKVSVLTLEDFSGFDGYLDNVERIGEALGEPAAARVQIDRFVARRSELEAARPRASARPSVVGWDYGHVPAANTSFDDAANCAGFVNVPSTAGLSGHPRVDAEQLVAWNPDWIVLSCGEGSCSEAIARLGAQPGFAALEAVVRGQVIAIEPPYLTTVGEGMLELAARMQAALLARGRP
jgi:iron complex transport system substrate-binding protein